jgi:hypothetical protein
VRVFIAGVLIACALGIAGLGSYVSLMTGLSPWLAAITLAFWFVASVFCLRITLMRNAWVRLLLPVCFLLLTYLVYGYGLREIMRLHYEKNGFPRRYYQTAPSK